MLTIGVGSVNVQARKYKSPFQWEPITDSIWVIENDSALDIHDAAMLFEKVHVDDGDRDRCYWTVYQRVRILNSDGRAWGDVEIPVFHADQKVEQVRRDHNVRC